jgi:lipoyl(octanoyl) transferase
MQMNDSICWLVDLGLISYGPAFELQRRVVSARKIDAVPDVLLLCEHPHVITLGRNGHQENLLASAHLLRQMNVEFHPSDRGGDMTYHGPGQIIGYPILNLAAIRRDVGWYMRQLEETLIRVTAEFGIEAGRRAGMTGVWVEAFGDSASGRPAGAEKLGAIGVHLSRWVTSHGFAYNVSTDLRYFDLIVPCGLRGKRATSLERRLGRAVHRDEVAPLIVKHFAGIFGREIHVVSRETLEENLRQEDVPAHASA